MQIIWLQDTVYKNADYEKSKHHGMFKSLIPKQHKSTRNGFAKKDK